MVQIYFNMLQVLAACTTSFIPFPLSDLEEGSNSLTFIATKEVSKI